MEGEVIREEAAGAIAFVSGSIRLAEGSGRERDRRPFGRQAVVVALVFCRGRGAGDQRGMANSMVMVQT